MLTFVSVPYSRSYTEVVLINYYEFLMWTLLVVEAALDSALEVLSLSPYFAIF